MGVVVEKRALGQNEQRGWVSADMFMVGHQGGQIALDAIGR